ncbi:hypothetical protein [Hymenobacter metallilatus]|uniref:Uncharacterized protein n=1 Tax=Hymenobacter metallilatus TaxID=2493666 RepID=A0A428JSF9_9BACT|nr:hypothetical protein [Hymenobacter metallilatus]RSK37087.1 hypothetical protein EI290_00005 [Hymenobacter metallilatus]
MKTLNFLRPLAVAVLLVTTVSACNTGTGTGDTNVERGAEKSLDPANNQPATVADDSAASGLRRDTSAGPTGRQQYEQAADTKDRNHDGIAD